MSQLPYFTYEGFGESVNYSQAVRIGNQIEISGQGGWNRASSAIPNSLREQMEAAFENVQYTLEKAGSRGWEDVYKIRALACPLDEEMMTEFGKCLEKWCPKHKPLVTGYGVKELAFGMKVEIEVSALIKE